MDINKIIVIIAVVAVLIAAFVSIPYAALILAAMGLAAGFSIAADAHVRVLVSALALNVLADSFGEIPAAGVYITAILGNLGTVLAGAAIMIILRNLYARLMS